MTADECVMDFNKICRLCLTEESFMSSIYNEQDKHSTAVPLPLRIMACVSIELNSLDGLPSHICTTCLCQVDGWYKFKDLCETADAVLRKCLKNEPVEVETISEIKSKAQDVRQFFASPHLVKVEGLDSALQQLDSNEGNVANRIKKRAEVSMEKVLGADRSEEITDYAYESDREAVNGGNGLLEQNASDYEGEEDEEEEGEVNARSGASSDKDFSSDDDLCLSAKKEMLLLEKNSKKAKQKKKRTGKKGEEDTVVRYLRTIKMQTELDEEDDEDGDGRGGLEVIETEVEKRLDKGSPEKKRLKSRKTQTPRGEPSGGKKRFRVRPAVPSSCTLCDKVYKNSEILRQHMKSHHVTGTIECSSCKLTFTSLRSLKYHEQRKHSNLEPVPCTFCGKKFLDKKYLRIHENIHSQANHFVCQFCGRKFIMKTNLTVHISRHHTTKSNDFICQICGKAFPFKLYLKKHFKTHTDYKPYQCSHCEARFRENTLLQKHVNSIHLKLRPFLCQYCHKTFTRSLYLREHMESQHLGIQKKVECSKCGQSFSNRNRLRQHECRAGGTKVPVACPNDYPS